MGSNRNNNDRKSAQVNAALMHASVSLLRDLQNPEEQYSTRCSAGYTPVATKTGDSAPAVANNNAEDAPAANSTQRTPTVTAHMALHRHVSRHIHAISAPGLHRH